MVLKSGYDLVVLDLKMPGKSGLEVLKEIKQHRPKLPVLILSMHRRSSLRYGPCGQAPPDTSRRNARVTSWSSRYGKH